MSRSQVVARGVALAILVGCVLSAVAIAAQTAGRDRSGGTPSMASNEKVQVAIASGKLLFVGASYTVGLGATAPRAGYAPVLAGNLDRRFTVAAASGTGFLNPGSRHQGTFAQRIEALPADLDPRIVVIQGGRNDVGYPQPALQAAARDTITLAQHRFAHAQVVVMGPIPSVVPVSPRLLATRNVVRAAARQTGAGFVDPIAQGWITQENERQFAGPVPAHPNDAGYRYIANRLLVDLPAALEQSQPPVDAPSDAPFAGATTLADTTGPADTTDPVGTEPAPSEGAGESTPRPRDVDAGGPPLPTSSPSPSPSASGRPGDA
ncbi:SGNH/GDSL hydrolase family protein [Jatrophihabitans sp. YIM 134969]